MLNFELSEEQLEIQKLARDFANKTLRPLVRELDDESKEFNWNIPKWLHELGFLGLLIPEEMGGAGKTVMESMIVMEELAAVEPGVCTTMGGAWLTIGPLLLAGTEAQWKKFFPVFVEEGGLGSSATTEPQGGSDLEATEQFPGALRTTARKVGDEYVLNGRKCFISNAGIASLYITLATLDRENWKENSCLFIVPKDTPGLSFGKPEEKMGLHSSVTGDVIFEDVRIPAENRIGPEGAGYMIHMNRLAMARGPVAAQAVGIARSAFETALAYAKERVQGGKLIIEHQAIATMLADMAIQIEAARLLLWKANWVNSTYLPPTRTFSTMAKVFCTDMAMKVTTDAIQVLGGYGYMKEYLLEKAMRDAKVLQIYEGPNQICRLAIAEDLM
jgi:alkylation response protein AidB-like acyl-CoA dehydrogenase